MSSVLQYAVWNRASGSNGGRPHWRRQKPLGPWEASDVDGLVHTTPPPELVLPTKPTRDFFYGDAWGVTLAETPPLVKGCNTTPREMVMSYLLPRYPRAWQDKILTAHAERGFWSFLIDRWNADDAGLSASQFADLIEYVQSWGFLTPVWLSGANDDRTQGWRSLGPVVTPTIDAFNSKSQAFLERLIALPGEECNNGCPPGPLGVDSIIRGVCAWANPRGVPAWLHLTSNYADYPMNPRTDASAVAWWQQWSGMLKGLAWQANQDQSAGLMGAKLYDARRILAAADPGLKVSAFEVLADRQLYGRATEEQGALRATELIYCPQGVTTQMVWGSMGGPRLPSGDPLIQWAA